MKCEGETGTVLYCIAGKFGGNFNLAVWRIINIKVLPVCNAYRPHVYVLRPLYTREAVPDHVAVSVF